MRGRSAQLGASVALDPGRSSAAFFHFQLRERVGVGESAPHAGAVVGEQGHDGPLRLAVAPVDDGVGLDDGVALVVGRRDALRQSVDFVLRTVEGESVAIEWVT
jgi:hypothetical protein